MDTIPASDFITYAEAAATFRLLADVLEEQKQPLIALKRPDIMLDPQRTALLLRTFFATDGTG